MPNISEIKNLVVQNINHTNSVSDLSTHMRTLSRDFNIPLSITYRLYLDSYLANKDIFPNIDSDPILAYFKTTISNLNAINQSSFLGLKCSNGLISRYNLKTPEQYFDSYNNHNLTDIVKFTTLEDNQMLLDIFITHDRDSLNLSHTSRTIFEYISEKLHQPAYLRSILDDSKNINKLFTKMVADNLYQTTNIYQSIIQNNMFIYISEHPDLLNLNDIANILDIDVERLIRNISNLRNKINSDYPEQVAELNSMSRCGLVSNTDELLDILYSATCKLADTDQTIEIEF